MWLWCKPLISVLKFEAKVSSLSNNFEHAVFQTVLIAVELAELCYNFTSFKRADLLKE
jgi:hypothetical protein